MAEEVTDPDTKRNALTALVDGIVPGRSAHVRGPSDKELAATTVLRLPLTEASVKVRTGPPVDDADDLALPYWAGVLPLSPVRGDVPQPAPDLAPGIDVPDHVTTWARG